MKKLIVILVPVIVVASAALLAILFFLPSSATPAKPAGKLMSIESYVTQHITDLSPKKATLGGTFQVTSVDLGTGTGTVSYEDGHNVYTADFSYQAADQTGIQITSFVVRK